MVVRVPNSYRPPGNMCMAIYLLPCVHIGCVFIQDLPTMEMLDPLNRKISFFIEVRMFEHTLLL